MKKLAVILILCGLAWCVSNETAYWSVDGSTGAVEFKVGQSRVYGNKSTGTMYVASNAIYVNKKWYRATTGLASLIEQTAGVITVKHAVTGAAGSQITWVTAYTVSAAGGFALTETVLNIGNIPTTINGIATGDVYSASGTLKIK